MAENSWVVGPIVGNPDKQTISKQNALEQRQQNHYDIPSGQIIIFHQPRFPWNKGISLTKPPFGVKTRVFGRYNLTRFHEILIGW